MAKDQIDDTLKILQKRFGKMSAVRGSEDSLGTVEEVIPTGVEVIDHHLIAIGGLPVGRISEVYGMEGCGKSALALTALASCQRHGGVAVLADPEQSFDRARAESVFGINTSELILLQPEYMEELIEQVKVVLSAHSAKSGMMLIVWDSIACTKTKGGLTMEAGEYRVGEVPRLLSEELRKILEPLKKHRAHLMLLNQIRTKIGVLFGPNTTTPGGHGPKFYSSWRMEFFGGKGVKDAAGKHLAKVVTCVTQKTRFSEPFRKAKIRFDYERGYDNEWSTLDHAKDHGGAQRGAKGAKAHAAALVSLGWQPSLTIVEGESKKDEEE
jgi:recombination protein RecA